MGDSFSPGLGRVERRRSYPTLAWAGSKNEIWNGRNLNPQGGRAIDTSLLFTVSGRRSNKQSNEDFHKSRRGLLGGREHLTLFAWYSANVYRIYGRLYWNHSKLFQSLACSHAYATRNMVASENILPMICIPTGRMAPSWFTVSSRPTGNVKAGKPVWPISLRA